MNLVKLFSRGVGVATILASGIAFADDVVRVDILPGSSIRLGVNVVAFGQDPPTSTLNNVSITDDGTGVGSLLVARNDISFAPIDLVVSFYTVHAELRAQSDLIGTYDRRSGWLTAAGDFDLKLTSNAPGFNNSTCIIPATTLAISTDDAGGWSFVSGKGTAVDNTFSVNAVPHGRCGSYVAFDYADLLNVNLSLPSRSGANTLALVMRMTPPLAPDQASDRIITSIAGDGVRRFAGDGAPATSASLYDPTGVAVDNSGNVFVADYNNHRIRRVDAITGIITTVAGNGAQGFSGDGGLATDASLFYPHGVAVDGAGNLFIADYGNDRIRRVDAVTGIISTVAGTGIRRFDGDGGLATGASLFTPTGAAVDEAGNLFIADYGNQRIRRVDAVTNIITTVGGNGVQGFVGDGGLATDASLNNPMGVAVDGVGNLFVADSGNQRVRRVDAITGIITTKSGTGTQGFGGDGGPAASARLNIPTGVAVDRTGNVFIADFGNQRIRLVDAATNIIRTTAGNGIQGFGGDGGRSTGAASLNLPEGVAVDGYGRLFIADTNNHRIRLVVP